MRPPVPDDARLWSLVTATVRPLAGRPADPSLGAVFADASPSRAHRPAAPPPPAAITAPPSPAPLRRGQPLALAKPIAPEGIEPNRRRRIMKGREAFAVRLDLHGFDQDQARARLTAALVRAQGEGARAILVITGKGSAGDGVLRRRVPEWLGDPRLREVVAGFASADRRHGGEGALYVALKRRG